MFLFWIAAVSADVPPALPVLPLMVDLGHSDSEIWVKLAPGVARLPSAPFQAEPLFSSGHPELSRWWRVQTSPGAALSVAEAWLDAPWVSRVELALLPVDPPSDLPPTTPDLESAQGYLGPAPDGFGVAEAALWPGGGGENVALADLEYDWLASHEDLAHLGEVRTWGQPTERFAYHGTGVLGITSAGDNGYGVTGMVPEAEVVMIHPVDPDGVYNVAGAIEASIALLDPGDVLLIEQQSYIFDAYAPVEISAAVSDAIEAAVAAGIVVVEPSGNGAQDLDDEKWQGWFDRSIRDSGAILVGGGMPAPGTPFNPARSWYPSGSCYGSRIDLQGWYGAIASTASGNLNDELFNVEGDERQSYTAAFGGTSGASPQVASLAAQFQSIAIAMGRGPWEPLALRQLMVQTGTPQAEPEAGLIGPQPDLRAMLRMAGLR